MGIHSRQPRPPGHASIVEGCNPAMISAGAACVVHKAPPPRPPPPRPLSNTPRDAYMPEVENQRRQHARHPNPDRFQRDRSPHRNHRTRRHRTRSRSRRRQRGAHVVAGPLPSQFHVRPGTNATIDGSRSLGAIAQVPRWYASGTDHSTRCAHFSSTPEHLAYGPPPNCFSSDVPKPHRPATRPAKASAASLEENTVAEPTGSRPACDTIIASQNRIDGVVKQWFETIIARQKDSPFVPILGLPPE